MKNEDWAVQILRGRTLQADVKAQGGHEPRTAVRPEGREQRGRGGR